MRDMTAGVPHTTGEDDWLTGLYLSRYGPMVRLAAVLQDDSVAAEDIVQEAFIRVAAAKRRLRDQDKAAAYLQTTVINLSRSVVRRRRLMARHDHTLGRSEETTSPSAQAFDRVALIVALRSLPRRFREVLALRYFLDMTETQTADALGISVGSVKSYASRGRSLLEAAMKEVD